MDKVDDLIFGDFVANNLSHEDMVEVEKKLIDSEEANSSLLASIAFYSINRELSDELLGEENISQDDDRMNKIDDSIVVKPKKQENMSNSNKFNLAPGAAAAVAVSAQKLFGMYKSGQFDYFTNKNVASSIDVLNDDLSDSKTSGSVVSSESTGSIGESTGGIGFAQAETTHGQPNLDIEFDPETYQYYPDTCAFQSQALILREYGFNVTQEDLVEVAKVQGWYVDGYGTPADKVGKLLEYYGVDTSITEGNNIFNLANELAQNHHVLVTVDSGELWAPGMGEKLEDLLIREQADHALLVVGIDTSNPSDVKVIVTDPGNGNTQYAYSEKQFMEAWKDSNCFMVSTNESPEEFITHTEYSPMPTFADIPYDYIARLSESGISVADTECYHEFFDELMSNPAELDSLMNEYSNLFEDEGDDVDFADDSE
ncbi:C39 family peptidase [Bacteroides salyersiae]|uniref:C39 family peptidase n=1 Tax=Bacteroides salyersiae TaxID=291644 RepID=UPI001C389380|nr:C39 family peptidase [Bacteroides salyersiae]MBV4203539.1 C39 family peptidase [Bacteroides salyersiae]MCB6648891.1 C39 family peptidase [Bacteroides salyersiae]